MTNNEIDCEQSPFFFRFGCGSVRARTSSGEAARRAKLRGQSRACFVYFRISGVSFDGLRKKETVKGLNPGVISKVG